MSTFIPDNVGRPVEVDLIRDLFEAEEGSIDQIYGRVGQGKTYCATRMILDDLSNGQSVYANFRLHFEGHDDRLSLKWAFRNFFFFRKRFYRFPKENFHYIEIDDNFMDRFEKLTDCKVYLDEGHIIFDSYEMTKMSLRKRKSILHTRHFNRCLIIISQRPTAVHVSARGNVNRFFKCVKLMQWPRLLFRVSEYQEMTGSGETVDESVEPVSKRLFWGSKRVLNAYNSKYLRGGIPRSQKVYVEAFDLTFAERFRVLFSAMFRLLPLKRKQTPAPPRGDVGGSTSIASVKNGGQGAPVQTAVGAEDDIVDQTLPF